MMLIMCQFMRRGKSRPCLLHPSSHRGYWPENRRCVLLFACLIGTLILMPGCEEDGIPLEVKPQIDLPALLLSEVRSAPDRTRLGQCPIDIKNPGTVDTEVTLLRSGCTCYGVTLNGERLENGQSLIIPARQTRTIRLEFPPAESHSEKLYTVDLAVKKPGKEPQMLSVKCRQRVISDVRVTPNTITVEAIPHQGAEMDQEISIEHVSRGNGPAPGTPDFPRLPPGMTITDVKRSGPAEKLEKSLWKQMWSARAHIELPEHHSTKPTPISYNVAFAGESPEETVTARGNLMVHLRQTIIFPNRVNFGKMSIGKCRSRRILLSHIEDNAFRLNCNPALLPPGVKVELNDHPDRRHFVTLTMTPDHPGPFSETVKLQTDMYDILEIAIHVEGIAE